ncbi:MAG: gamma-glutamyltransferase [Bacteroidetes bacterium]|nr:gamma-glutamyltransferase [Bacteroidota bacterium]
MLRYLRTLSLALILLGFIVQPAWSQAGKSPVKAKNGMVSSVQELASEVGKDILMQGGNAVDAAIATAFALAVVHPAAGNIGGGGFLVYHGADGEVTAFNFREKAPLAATIDMMQNGDGSISQENRHYNLLSTGVPGTVAGLVKAHERLGSLPWALLVQPAVRLAEEGFPFTWDIMNWERGLLEKVETDPIYQSTIDAFLKPGGIPHEPGELLVQLDLAESLKRIRDHGHDGFYGGETARLMAEFMSEWGGLITQEDLAAYQAEEQAPIHGTYRGYDIYSMSPPSSGGVAVVTMLNILEGYNLSEMGHNSAAYLHVLTEAMRRAYADRAQFVGDPNFNPDMPVDWLISKEHAEDLRSTIDLTKASESDESLFNGNEPYESEETTHFSVVDEEGNTVSLTYTLEYGYGNSIVVDGAGFILNNEMGDFNPKQGLTDRTGTIGTDPNLVAPQKRMLSSMTPTIVAKDGKPLMAIGSPGGRTIINTALQVILNVIDHDMNIARAVEAPRIHHQWLPDVTSFERGYISADTERLYRALGHELTFRGAQGSAMGIWIDWETGIKYGAADSRAYNSRAIGY